MITLRFITASLLALTTTSSSLAAVNTTTTITTPKQGVFVMSNEVVNQVGVFEIANNGSLQWAGEYDTGGIGYPVNTNTGFNAWTSSNCLSYHVWNDRQWLLVANIGRPDGQNASITLFEIRPDLQLVRTGMAFVGNKSPDGGWAYSVTGYGNRACVLGARTSVWVQCFGISSDGQLSTQDYLWYDLNLTIAPDITLRGHSGSASIQFSPDGTKLGVLSKGSVTQTFPLSRIPTSNVPQRIDSAAMYMFPVDDDSSSYGEPQILNIDPYDRPYDFVWHPSSDRVWTVGVPTGVVGSPGFTNANIISINVTEDSGRMEQVGIYRFGFRAGCWLEYWNGVLYSSNFVVNHDLSLLTTNTDGSVNTDSRTDFAFGANTGPVDEAISGVRMTDSGEKEQFLYIQLATSIEVAALKLNQTDGSVSEVGRYPIGGSARWTWNAGVAATLLSEEELIELYEQEEKDGEEEEEENSELYDQEEKDGKGEEENSFEMSMKGSDGEGTESTESKQGDTRGNITMNDSVPGVNQNDVESGVASFAVGACTSVLLAAVTLFCSY